jgi:hypothetical protein
MLPIKYGCFEVICPISNRSCILLNYLRSTCIKHELRNIYRERLSDK